MTFKDTEKGRKSLRKQYEEEYSMYGFIILVSVTALLLLLGIMTCLVIMSVKTRHMLNQVEGIIA